MSGPDRSQASTQGSVTSAAQANFFLYVEGPRDAAILRIWARRISRQLARRLESRVVILGGRRPARAQEHFRAKWGEDPQGRGLVVLDRDHHGSSDTVSCFEPGLEVFIWKRRHIESYLLVPDAIRRSLARVVEPRLLDRLIEGHVPASEDEAACRTANAKEILGAKGELGRSTGGRLSPAGVARCMWLEDFHPDILALYERIRCAAGLPETAFANRVRLPPPVSRPR